MPQEMKMFSKSLTDTDIKKRLAIPVKILSSLPHFNGSHAVTIPLLHGTRAWRIVCSVRKTGHKKPVFSVGWRNFVVCNDFHVGDKLTLYKVQDEAGSFHYRVEVEKLPTSFVARSLNDHEVDETSTCTNRTKISNFEHQQEQLPKADAPVKQEGAFVELADDARVPYVDHVIAIGLSNEATIKTPFEPNHETEVKLHACYKTKEEGDIKAPFDLDWGGLLAPYGTSQADGEVYSEGTGRLSLDLILGQPSPYHGEVNLDLSLGQPIADFEEKQKSMAKPVIIEFDGHSLK